jgi:acetylornithine deacetylase/succinyl-diaminopimelate desuccinylase-like protein
MPEPRQPAIDFSKQNYSRFVEELKTFLSIPSVSTDTERVADMLRAAEYLVTTLTNGLSFDKAGIFETKRHPVVFAEKSCGKPDAKTVLIYGHYDVQPCDPIDLWKSDPFKPEQRGEHLYARGSSDMKGQIWAALKALESMQAAGDLPVNVKCIFEGEEELGSPNLDTWIAEHVDLLACDVVLNPDSGMLAPNVPTIGLRPAGPVLF